MDTAAGFSCQTAPSLAERTSIGLGGVALAELRPRGPGCLEKLPELAARIGGRIAPFGRGTDIIAAEGELPLVLVTQTGDWGARVIKESKNSALVRVQAGMRLPALLARASALSLSGLEGLCGIPGSVGGAVAMNAGSYGATLGERVRAVGLFSPRLGLVERSADDFAFAYRSFALRDHPDWFLVTEVTLELKKGDKGKIRAAMRATFADKQAGQPVRAKSAGCVFKNPAPGISAGRLLEEAGLKGLRLGRMRFSPLHANFLVNEGGGAFSEAMQLIELAKEKVKRHSGHDLELEVRLWP